MRNDAVKLYKKLNELEKAEKSLKRNDQLQSGFRKQL
jgi:hypothetical protein